MLLALFHRELHIDNRLFRQRAHQFRLGVAKGDLQVTLLQVDRAKGNFGDGRKLGAQVLALRNFFLGDVIEYRELRRTSPWKIDISDRNVRAIDGVKERLNRTLR